MAPISHSRAPSRLLLLAVSATVIGLAVPAAGQNVAANESQAPPTASPPSTGVPPRGTKVAPSTNAAEASEVQAEQTGQGPRGTKVAPSTNPAEPTTPQKPKE
jgi:hypothetical protein